MLFRRTKLLALGSIVVLALSGCGNDTEPQTGGNDGGQTTEPTGAAGANRATVAVGESDLGDILVDGKGRTLYVFLQDTKGKSTCYDDCETNWPPLVAKRKPAAGEGVDASLLGTAKRTDGSTQVTYDEQPLYYFATDQAPGDVNGQGLGEVWYVVAPSGKPIKASA